MNRASVAEREARKAAREEERRAKAEALQVAIEHAQSALIPPPELGAFDVMKTRCWVSLHERLARQVGRKRKSFMRLTLLTSAIQQMVRWTPDRCARVHRALKDRTPLTEAIGDVT